MSDIFLFSGHPGHGKTLNAIKYVEENYGTDWTVFYYHIDELEIDRWQEISDPLNWDDCPPMSVIVVDEAHNYFPARAASKAVPACIKKMSEHRHLAIDLILITQHPHKLDREVLHLVSRHFHFVLPLGLGLVKRFEWQSAQDKPLSSSAQRDAVDKKFLRLDKKYFGLYKSAEVHTVKRRIPKSFYYLPLAIAFSAVCIWYFIHSMYSRSHLSSTAVVASPAVKNSVGLASASAPASTSTVDYAQPSIARVDVPVVRLSGVVDWGTGGVAIFEISGGYHRRLSLVEANCSNQYNRWRCYLDGSEYRL